MQLKYTIINPEDYLDGIQRETEFVVEYNDRHFKINNIGIDAQQLAELGILFFALANKDWNIDFESCCELLDGFAAPCPVEALKVLAKMGEEYEPLQKY